MLHVESRRVYFSDTATLSEIYLNDIFQCFGLEDTVREPNFNGPVGLGRSPSDCVKDWKIPCDTAIPQGDYDVIIDFSKRFQKDMIHILAVPGYDGVRVHSGNNSKDTEGCIIVGKNKNDKTCEVWNSVVARDQLFARIKAELDRKDSQGKIVGKVKWSVVGIPPLGAKLPYSVKSK
jgi:hypothetical protein